MQLFRVISKLYVQKSWTCQNYPEIPCQIYVNYTANKLLAMCVREFSPSSVSSTLFGTDFCWLNDRNYISKSTGCMQNWGLTEMSDLEATYKHLCELGVCPFRNKSFELTYVISLTKNCTHGNVSAVSLKYSCIIIDDNLTCHSLF